MNRLGLAFAIILAAVSVWVSTPAVEAQATRTWVSGVGDDANPCSRIAPCKTFAGAISKTAVAGEINCLDPGGFGAVTITKSITIDCHEIFGSVANALVTAILINFDSFGGGDTQKTVRLRNLNLNGAGTGLVGVRIIGGGVVSTAGSAVFIEDLLIDGDFGGTMRGVSDERTTGGELSISNTTIRNLGGTAIVILPATGATRIDATLDNVRVQNANFGTGLNNGARVMINRSVFSGHTSAGIFAAGSVGPVEVNVNNTVVSDNGTGIQNGGGNVIFRLSNNDIAFNGTGITGQTFSFLNNRISGNTSAGTAPTATTTGQQ